MLFLEVTRRLHSKQRKRSWRKWRNSEVRWSELCPRYRVVDPDPVFSLCINPGNFRRNRIRIRILWSDIDMTIMVGYDKLRMYTDLRIRIFIFWPDQIILRRNRIQVIWSNKDPINFAVQSCGSWSFFLSNMDSNILVGYRFGHSVVYRSGKH